MRDFAPATLAALESGRFGLRSLVRFDLDAGDGGPVGIWDDVYNITVAGVVYHRAAGRFTVSPVQSTADLSVRNCDIVMSSLDTGQIATILTKSWHQRPVLVSLGLFPVEQPQTLDVYPWFAGFVDQMIERDKSGGNADLVIKLEGGSRELGRRSTRYRSDADQRQIDPNDGFFQHVTQSIQQDLQWGRTSGGAA